MKSFRKKLIYPLVTLLLFVFVGIGFLIGQLYKNYYVNLYNDYFTRIGSLSMNIIDNMGGLKYLNESSLEELTEGSQGRITIIDKEGNIIYDAGETANRGLDHQQTVQEIFDRSETEETGIFHDGSLYDIAYYWKNIKTDNEKEGVFILSSKMKELNKAYSQIWIFIFICFGLAFLMILYIGTKIMDRYTKPLDSATQTAIELAKGNYSARIYEDGYEEVGKLSSSINILARNLQKITKEQENHKNRLQTLIENMGTGLILIDDKGIVILTNKTFNETFNTNESEVLNKSYEDVIVHKEIKDIIHDVFMTEQRSRKQVIIQIGIHTKNFEVYGAPILNEKNKWMGIVVVFHDITELKKLEQIRKDFVANVSHELKTPITSIRGFAETLLDGALNDKKALEQFLKIILDESERLQSIISELLELSKIEQHGYKLKLEMVDVTDVISGIINILRARAEEKSIELIVNNDGRPYFIEGEGVKIKQIFINLISNAISYTPKNGRVEVGFKENEEFVIVSVCDNGIGIDAKELPRIFERFYRVDKARSRDSGGTGLGLSIVKHFVEVHHGDITVESEQGKGTTFTIYFRKKIS